jgi:DNA polymerase-3 subunit epsilon
MLTRPTLRCRLFGIFAGLAAGFLLLIALGCGFAVLRLRQHTEPLDALLQGGLIAGFLGLGLVSWIWVHLDRSLAQPVDSLAGALRTGHPPTAAEMQHLGDLGPAVRDAVQARRDSDIALQQALDDLQAEAAHEKETLESILADFGAGAVMVDTGGRVVFFNQAALNMLPGLALDRPLVRFLQPGAVKAAGARLDAGAEATDLLALADDGRRIAARMRRIEDTTLLILRPERQDEITDEQIETLRRHAATLVPMLDALDGPMPQDLVRALRAEGQGLATTLRQISTAREQDTRRAQASLVELTAGLPPVGDLPDVSVQAQAGSMNALLLFLDRKLRGEGWDPHLRLAHAGTEEIQLLLEWRGDALAMDRLEAWLALAADPDLPDLTGDAILAAHATGIWPESRYGQSQLVLPLRLAAANATQGAVTYDFALARRGAASTRLSDLTCVVFDTETTGLNPDDRIVQIAGLRLARGRMTGERFETLVDPGRSIPPSATAIHRISDQMVVGAPDLRRALAAFQHFADDGVLVAHNAPFDMGFLRASSDETGLHFDNPVLDTVLLSAMIWGGSVPHTLDAICARLSIRIAAKDRHTAMGDAQATAQVFLKLIPALEAKGIVRIADVTREARQYHRLIGDANTDRA